MPHSLSDLTFNLPEGVNIIDKGNDYPIVQIDNTHSTAEIAISGAHVIQYQPKGQAPVLWLSETSAFERGRAIRGGIPLCWPWFGDHTSNSQLPAHGFARTDIFKLISIEASPSEETIVRLRLENNDFNQQYWADAFALDVSIVVGESLSVSMTMQNKSASALIFSSALHSYFTISDVDNVVLKGLDQTHYYDKVEDFAKGTQAGDITIEREFDRVYALTSSEVHIIDKGLDRTIKIAKSGSESTVVWNPWIDKAAAMSDFHNEGYRTMVCVETANALIDSINLAAGDSHTINTTITSQRND